MTFDLGDRRGMTTRSTGDLAARFAGTAFRWPLRRYQQLAVDAFERARAAGRPRLYIVMPPGAGKTALGLEVARRLGRRTLILCPNTAVQAQWLRQWQDFTPATVPASGEPDLAAPLTALTYQALCVLDSDDAALQEQTRTLWRETLQAEKGLAPGQAEAEIQSLASAAGDHYDAELSRFRQRARALVARGGDREQLLALLHQNGRDLIAGMKANGPWTLVLDECHHLLEMWGYLVRAVIEELDEDVFVVGLTATPPGDMDTREEALYRDIFGQADFEVAAPALVREGDLAPYQELVYLTTPLPHEADYIDAQHARFQELLVHLMDVDFASRPFIDWVRARVIERRSKDGAQVSWERFERDEPALAQAALRFFHANRIDPPEDARIGERHRRPPTADDWVALIDDFCMGYLRSSPDARDAAAWETIRQALPALGYILTRQGIRSYVSPVDRVLSLSASKAAAALDILEIEDRVLGANLRALVLCDYERAGSDLLARLRGVLDPQAGSAALLLHLLARDGDVAALNPVLVTGRTVACPRATAVDLSDWIERQVPELGGTLATGRLFEPGADGADPAWEDTVALRPASAWWQPRRYVPLLTHYFEEGRSRCLVGTRGLLGEGWDAKRVNVLIDLTAASTSTAVHQMRGRSLRRDPALPRKLADNWDVVCVAPDHPKGTADYGRFVRKHHRYYALTIEGEIESGVSHVHPELSPYGPPVSEQFGGINGGMLRRAEQRETAYERWRIGEPYENAEAHTLRVRFGRPVGLPSGRLIGTPNEPGAVLRFRRRLGPTLLAAVVLGVLGGLAGSAGLGLLLALIVALAGAVWMTRSLDGAVRRLGPSDALEDFALAVLEGLRSAGAVSPALGAAAVQVVSQSDGYYRCVLTGASEAESRLFSESLDELLAPLAAPRYIIPRYVARPPRSTLDTLRLALLYGHGGRGGGSVVYHAVPSYLAANKERVEGFRRAWNRYVSAGEPLYWKDPAAEAILEAQRGEDPFDVATQMRVLWQ